MKSPFSIFRSSSKTTWGVPCTEALPLRAGAQPVSAVAAQDRARIEQNLRKLRKPSNYVQDVYSASMAERLLSMRAEKAASKVAPGTAGLYAPVRLKTTGPCQLQESFSMGVFTAEGMNGFKQYLSCPGGDLVLQDMVLKGVSLTTIKELANAQVAGHSALIYGMRDAQGNSFTRLTWVSNNTHHLADKAGTGPKVRDWLVGYGKELVAQGR
ncbi:hypothetical protein [Pseudomonas abieticivorans]|uniref:hypothetical protein n=1 Tax=Pseudomonas abieticivorans TaxID=2931382 RepID=UPI0020BEEF16|nr:hypothetical protein [Pseudomonas sp. PIA16]